MKIHKKFIAFLSTVQKKQGLKMVGLMLIGMFLETIGVGLIIPAMALMSNKHLLDQYPLVQTFFSKLTPISWYSNASDPAHYQVIGGAMGFLLIIVVFKTVFFVFLSWKQVKFVSDIQLSISQRLYSAYLRQPYIFHLLHNSALLIRNVTAEVYLFSSVLTATVVLITELFILVGIVLLLLFAEPFGTSLVILVLLTASFIFQRFTKGRINYLGKARQFHEGQRMQHLQQGLGGVKDVKLMGREKSFINEFVKHNVSMANVARKLNLLQSLPRLWLELLAVFGLVVLIFVMLLKGNSTSVLIPTLSLFAASAFRLMPSANRIINSLQSIRFSMPVVDILHTELAKAILIENSQDTEHINEWNTIKINKITFVYPGVSAKALANVSLTIEKGSTVGFIGGSGAGKSTLIDIILGLLSPTKGTIQFNYVTLTDKNMRSWQNQIGYVPQHIYLTDDSLRNNIAFGLTPDEINDESIIEAIKGAQLYDFILTLPEGLNTSVGERGVRLSGGQRQRIGIARALYHKPEVLILDEATSALDVTTEEGVMSAVNSFKGNKTILIIAHRYSTVAKCDKLYRLEGGIVINEGSFEEVMAAL